MSALPLSVLDLATVGREESVRDALDASVALAQRAETLGYRRVWYAEHHNFPTIASSATAVLIGHIATHTNTIRLGSGGIMLPNHSPLTIAEQFGTLETLHPGRIDLGLGRAPGTDQPTLVALRRSPAAAERFPRDVVELRAFLADESLVDGVHATPGRGTRVPIYILGSSRFGAQLAATLGLPYGFASHFAPAELLPAVEIYRANFRPSEQLQEPWVIAGVNAIVAEDEAVALDELAATRRARVRAMLGRGQRTFTDEEADAILETPHGAFIRQMLTYVAVGTPDVAGAYVTEFARQADADEVIVAFASTTPAGRLRSLELLAGATDLGASPTPG